MSESAVILQLAAPLFAATVAVWGLIGSLTIQLYDYYNNDGRGKNQDPVLLKIVVYGIYLVEIMATLIITRFSWQVFIWNFGTVDDLLATPPYIASIPVITGFVASNVQFFFAWRIWRLTDNALLGRIIVFLIISVSLLQLASTAGTTIAYVLVVGNFTEITKIDLFGNLWLSAGLTTDVIIAITMVTILVRAKRHAFTSTETVLNRLIINTIETGAVTASLALVEIILFKIFPQTYYHIAVMFILGRMYSNVLLASLNGRHRSRNALETWSHHFGKTAPLATASTELELRVPTTRDMSTTRLDDSTLQISVHKDQHIESQKISNF